MTHKFKFGDRVIDKALGLGECVVINTSENSVYIINERGDYNAVAQPETLEIVPHPDTVRLDWLADKHNKIGSVILPTECVEQHLDSMRDAIDAAMQRTKAARWFKLSRIPKTLSDIATTAPASVVSTGRNISNGRQT